MARGDIRQRISLDGGEEVKRQLQQIGASGEKALRELSAATSSASTNLLGVSNVARDLQAVFGRLGGLGVIGGGAFSAIGSAAAGMTTAVGATIATVAAATAGLGALAISGAKAASDIKEGAIRVGVAADDYTKMNFVFSQSGSSAEGFEKAMSVILDASAKAAEAAAKAAADIAAADGKIKQSAADATAEIGKTYRARAEDARVLQKAISDTLGGLAQDEARALRDIERGRKDETGAFVHKQLTAEEEIRRQFAERREDAQKAHFEKLAEQKKKDAAEDREATIRRNKEQASLLAAYNKTLEDAANAAGDPFAKITQLTKGDGSARDPVEVFKDIAVAVASIPDPAGRAAKAIELFGRRVGGQLTESLSEGRDGIEMLAKEAEDLGLVFSPEQLKIGKAFSDTLSKLGDVTKATTAKIGLEFSGMFGDVGEGLAAAFGGAQGPTIAAAKSIADMIKPVFDDITSAIAGDTDKINSQFIRVLIPTVKLFGQALLGVSQIVGDVGELLRQSFVEIAGLINDVFGTKVTAGDIPAFAAAVYLGAKAIGVLTAGFGALTLAASPWLILIGGIALALGALFLPLDTLKTGLSKIFGEETTAGIVKFVADFRAGAKELYDTFVGTIQGIKDIWNNGLIVLQDTWTTFTTWLGERWQTLVVDPINQGIQTVIYWVNYLIGLASQALSAIGLLPGAGSSSESNQPLGLASGGLIRGPGTGTSDSILARLSDHEYVIRSAAVKHFGVGFFDALNRLRSPQFALGGLVDALSTSLVPRSRGFRSGGLVAAGAGGRGGTPVYLQIHGGKAIGPMIADRDVLGALHREAKRAKIFSAGPAPSSVG